MRDYYEKRRRTRHYEEHTDWREQRSYAEVVRSKENSRENEGGEKKKIKKDDIRKGKR